MTVQQPPQFSTLQIWVMASRPKTLLAAFVPVFVGAALAYAEGKFVFLGSLIALLCALLIQVGTNFTNDLYDHLKGADTKERKGPIRVLNAGLVSVRTMQTAIAITFGLSFVLGLTLVYLNGPIILLIGVASILAGLAYTAGPFPLAYNGLGDVFVFLFFGLVATVGTYYVNTGTASTASFLAAIPVGALITNILVVNNYRDIEQDKKAGKNTLAVIFGKSFAYYQYALLLISSYVIPILLYHSFEKKVWIFLPILSVPIALKLLIALKRNEGSELNKSLELTAKLSAIFGVLFSIGLAL